MQKIVLSLLFISGISYGADTYVNGYYKQNGTYVQGHYRSAPNDTKLDNYSTRGNTNPYTGSQGTADPYKQNTYQPQSNNPYINGTNQNSGWGK